MVEHTEAGQEIEADGFYTVYPPEYERIDPSMVVPK